MSEEAPKVPEGRRQLGIGSFFKPAPPITQQQREEQQEAVRKKFQDMVAQANGYLEGERAWIGASECVKGRGLEQTNVECDSIGSLGFLSCVFIVLAVLSIPDSGIINKYPWTFGRGSSPKPL